MEDHLYKYLKLYRNSPPWLKYICGAIYGLFSYETRFGKNYKNFRTLAEEARTWSHEEHKAFQERKLKTHIQHAYNHVQFYRRKFQEAGVGPGDFQTLDDLTRFPLLSRAEIRENFNDMVANDIPAGKRLYKTTSGSSGEPLELFQQKGITRAKEHAFQMDMYKMIGFKPRDRTVVLMGETIRNIKKPWHYEPIERQLIMSSYLIGEGTLDQYCRQIRRFRPSFIRGYPFIVFRLVNLMRASSQRPFPLKGIMLASENVYDTHLKAIESFFKCPVYHFYGHTECAVIGGICPKNQAYHMSPEYGVAEIINTEGRHAQIGEQGEIIATSFDNWVMPLIRYRTQDFAIYGGDHCTCGLNFPLIQEILGREDEYVILRAGEQIPFHSLLAGVHGDVFAMARNFQFIQSEPGRLLLKIMPDPRFEIKKVGSSFLEEIWKRVNQRMLELSVEYVKEIPISSNGKTKAFISKIAAEKS